MPGVAEQVREGPFLVPKRPSASDCAPGAAGGGIPAAVVGVGVLGAVGAAVYLLLLR